MELHHKLRRDPNWHKDACNICGGMGHQAANCKTGCIPWREVFGDEAFIVNKPVFWTDILAKREAKNVDYEELKQEAVRFAQERCQAQGRDYADVELTAKNTLTIDTDKLIAQKRKQVEEEEERARRAADPEADIPAGWAVAYDAKKKPYYWHTETQKVQWDKPTATTPIS